jgi:hypothetical protein
MKKKLKATPDWLRMLRRFYAYLGAGALAGMFTVYHVNEGLQNKLFFWYGVGAFAIQLICDITFKEDKLTDLPADPINPKIKL